MAFLFNLAPLAEGSRLTHVWDNRRVSQERTGQTVSAHFVRLPQDQHADIESDFVSSHLPFSLEEPRECFRTENLGCSFCNRLRHSPVHRCP